MRDYYHFFLTMFVVSTAGSVFGAWMDDWNPKNASPVTVMLVLFEFISVGALVAGGVWQLLGLALR